ncbi:MAG: FitA-like ribbon-helix-helix domain-containing protein [Gammaproteobacteria bacterium]
MPVTMTIKQVPDRLASQLRRRAEANRRSLQRELLLIIEHAADEVTADHVREPAHPIYRMVFDKPAKPAHKSRAGTSTTPQTESGRLSLEALWRRARQLGAQMPAESSEIIRRDRDARHGH